MKKEKLLTILGPTAVGKTELSVYLAKFWSVPSFPVTLFKYIAVWISVQQR